LPTQLAAQGTVCLLLLAELLPPGDNPIAANDYYYYYYYYYMHYFLSVTVCSGFTQRYKYHVGRVAQSV
jgi:hypothetical protein